MLGTVALFTSFIGLKDLNRNGIHEAVGPWGWLLVWVMGEIPDKSSFMHSILMNESPIVNPR